MAHGKQDYGQDHGGDESLLEQDYLPLNLAADLTGYSRAQVQRLIRCGSVSSRLVRGRRIVDVGSLMQHRADVKNTPHSARIAAWLDDVPTEKRDNLSFRNLAALARAELGIQVDHVGIYRAWKRLGLPPRRRTKG